MDMNKVVANKKKTFAPALSDIQRISKVVKKKLAPALSTESHPHIKIKRDINVYLLKSKYITVTLSQPYNNICYHTKEITQVTGFGPL